MTMPLVCPSHRIVRVTSLKSYIILNIVPLRLIGTVCPSHTRAGPGTPTARKRLLNENIKRELFWCKRRSWILFIPCSFRLKVLSSFLWSYKGINLVENLGMSAEWFWKIALSTRWALAENGRWTPNYIIEPTRLDTEEIWHKKSIFWEFEDISAVTVFLSYKA